MAANNGKLPHLDNDLAEMILKKLNEEDAAVARDADDIQVTSETGSSNADSQDAQPQTISPQENETTREESAEDASHNDVSVKDEVSQSRSMEKEPEEHDQEELSASSEKEIPGKKSFPWKKVLIIAAIVIIVIILGALAAYYVYVQRYKTVFFDNTYINGINASNMTAAEIKETVKNLSRDYEITISSRYRDDETVSAEDVGLIYVTGDEIDEILSAQKPLEYLLVRNDNKEYDIPAMLSLDDEKLKAVCSTLAAFDDTTATPSVNAEIGDYDAESSEYTVIPEINGNTIKDKNAATAFIKDAILRLDAAADLETIADKIYPVADIRSDSAELLTDKARLDRFVGTKITYTDADIVLDGSTVKDWLIKDENGDPALDDDKIKQFVAKLAEKLDTVGKERSFKSWYGNDTHVSGGTFGWEVDQETEFTELKALISETGVTDREPVYKQRGITHGDSDWGDTYVEVNLAKQHLFFIKNGELVVETDVVSGGLQRKAGTPTGVYTITYKSRNAVLRGPRKADGSYEWESPVSYWMPFNKGIGLHDASWRSSFGGNIYRYSGSHGCVNLPKKNAKIIFENIEAGTPVIVYDDDFVIVTPEEETETETETETKRAVKPTQAQTQAETQPVTEPVQSETEAELPVETETATQGEIGPGVTQEQTTQEIGPAFDNAETASVDITYNAENLPGEMQ